jgi:uncharacterized damage-inducible protein DinB
MESKEFIHHQMAGVRKQVEGVLNGMTDEQFNWTPPGTGNSISSTYIHMLASEDRSIQVTLQGKQRIWDVEGWAEKIGLQETPGVANAWEPAKGKSLTLSCLSGYEQAVRAATEVYLAQLTSQELDRKITVNGRERLVADVISGTALHIMLHAGEIAALKGMQGIKGLSV